MFQQSMKETKKQVKCNICNAEFGEKSTLNAHVVTDHEGKKQLKFRHTADDSDESI